MGASILCSRESPTHVTFLPPAKSAGLPFQLCWWHISCTTHTSCVQDRVLLPQAPLHPQTCRVHSGAQLESKPLKLQGNLLQLVLRTMLWHITPLRSPAMLFPAELLASSSCTFAPNVAQTIVSGGCALQAELYTVLNKMPKFGPSYLSLLLRVIQDIQNSNQQFIQPKLLVVLPFPIWRWSHGLWKNCRGISLVASGLHLVTKMHEHKSWKHPFNFSKWSSASHLADETGCCISSVDLYIWKWNYLHTHNIYGAHG